MTQYTITAPDRIQHTAKLPASKSISNRALIMSGASVIAYIIGEGMADAAGASGDHIYLPEEKPPEKE